MIVAVGHGPQSRDRELWWAEKKGREERTGDRI